MAENFQMLGNAVLMERSKIAFLSSRRVAPAAVMRIEHDYEFAKRQGPDLSPALHRIAEAQRSVNNPSWGSPSIISNLFELRKGVNFAIHQFLQFAARADELWMRYDGWSFGADECHAGYAFFK